jgi:putative transposase
MSSKRRTLTNKFKAKVGLDAIRGVKTSAQLASEHKVHANQISTWKKVITSEAESLFSKDKESKSKTEEEISAPLYEEIGRLKMENDWLKKNS